MANVVCYLCPECFYIYRYGRIFKKYCPWCGTLMEARKAKPEMPEKERSITYKLTPKEKENLVSFLAAYTQDEKDRVNLRALFEYIETLISERDKIHD